MWIKCHNFKQKIRDAIVENNPINLDCISRLYPKDHSDGKFTIDFEVQGGKTIWWEFSEKETRDETFVNIIRNFTNV